MNTQRPATVDSLRTCICPPPPAPQGNERHLMCIEDPFELSHDLGRTIDKAAVQVGGARSRHTSPLAASHSCAASCTASTNLQLPAWHDMPAQPSPISCCNQGVLASLPAVPYCRLTHGSLLYALLAHGSGPAA